MTRTEASRANGALSAGPVTPEGKATSARNSLKHGLNSSMTILPNEDPAEFAHLLQSLLNRIRPLDAFETEQVLQAATALWRKRRIRLMESALFLQERDRLLADASQPTDLDIIDRDVHANLAGSPGMRSIHRHETRLQREFDKAISALVDGRMPLPEHETSDFQNEPAPRPAAVPAPAPKPQTASPEQLRKAVNTQLGLHGEGTPVSREFLAVARKALAKITPATPTKAMAVAC